MLHPELEKALSALPADFRRRLLQAYATLKDAYAKEQYDACGLRAGKFCEVMLRFLQHELTGTNVPFGQKIGNFSDEARRLEKRPKAAGHESVRITIPRALEFVYTLRNKRDIGHVGGDVDANEIDAVTSVRVVDWCMAEVIRLQHQLTLEDAQELLDRLAERELPLVWSVTGRKRILDSTLSQKEQTLCLLYSQEDAAVLVEDLYAWMDVTNISNYRQRVLLSLHKERLIEFDKDSGTAIISPSGSKEAQRIMTTSSIQP